MNEEETTHNPRTEWISFGIFVAVLVIVMLVVAVSRPLIFGRIVPAVIGDSSPRYGQGAPAEEPAPEEEAPTAAEETSTEEDASVEEPIEEEPTEETPTETYPDPAPADTETVQDPATEQTEPTEQTPDTQPAAATDTQSDTSNAVMADQPAADDSSFIYTVRAGDTLYQIARRYNTTSEEIIAATDSLSNLDDVIVPGMEIVIPRR